MSRGSPQPRCRSSGTLYSVCLRRIQLRMPGIPACVATFCYERAQALPRLRPGAGATCLPERSRSGSQEHEPPLFAQSRHLSEAPAPSALRSPPFLHLPPKRLWPFYGSCLCKLAHRGKSLAQNSPRHSQPHADPCLAPFAHRTR